MGAACGCIKETNSSSSNNKNVIKNKKGVVVGGSVN